MAFLYDQGKYGVKRDKKKRRKCTAKAELPAMLFPPQIRSCVAGCGAGSGTTVAEAREQARTPPGGCGRLCLGAYNLGVMYQTGFGLPKDMAKAREWFQKAADQGDVQAKSVLKKLR